MPVLLEVAVTTSGCPFSLAGPAVMPDRFTVEGLAGSSLMVTLLMLLSVGGSLTALTVTRKLRLMVLLSPWPSLTVTVTVAVPLALATGVKASRPVLFGLV